jgi:hypothetical protein
MTLDASGRLAVGTTTALSNRIATFQNTSAGNNRSTIYLQGIYSSTNDSAGIDFGSTNGTAVAAIRQVMTNPANGESNLAFYTWNGSSLLERLTITSAGSVGVGMTSPPYLLSVGTISGGTVAITTNSQSGNNASPVNTDLRFLGYNNGNLAMIRSWDAAGNTVAGQLTFWTNSDTNSFAERMRITNGGTLYVNTTTNPVTDNATPQLGILAGASTDAVNIKHIQNGNNTVNIWQTGTSIHSAIAFYKGDTQTNRGLIRVDTSGTSYTSVSDYRLKENITPIENGLDRLMQLKPSKFNWIETGNESEGFIAHELQEIFPGAVTGEKDAVYSSTGNIKPQTVDYGRITPLLVKAIQELSAKVAALEAQQ